MNLQEHWTTDHLETPRR